MAATTPGFTLAERTWIGFDPGSSLWAQLLPFFAGVCGIPAIYLLVRYWRLARWLALSAAFVVAVSPIAAQYSTHVKEYSTDFLLACLILWRGEATRRSPSDRALILLGLSSGVAVLVSGSVVPVVAGSWAAVFLCHLRDRDAVRQIVAGCVGMVAFLGVAYLLFFRTLSGVLHRFWANGGAFLNHSSLHALWDSFSYALSVITVGVFAPAGHTDVYGGAHWTAGRIFLPAALLLIVVLLGSTAGGRAAAPGLTLLAAVAASLVGAIPLGTGRTDEVLYPAVIVLAVLGVHQIVQQSAAWSTRLRHAQVIGPALLTLAVGLFAVLSLNSYSVRHPNGYPVINVRQLATTMKEHTKVGDWVLVDPYTRYDWTLYEANQVHVVFGPSWGAGFTVTSDESNVFVSPSEPWEDGYHPERWVSEVATAKRLWYLGTDVLSRSKDPVYRALVVQGWKPQKEYDASGGFLILMTRGRVPANAAASYTRPA
jgi:4-amino-4-deoxy-L-arabinose transferase-like glycosyltransferase